MGKSNTEKRTAAALTKRSVDPEVKRVRNILHDNFGDYGLLHARSHPELTASLLLADSDMPDQAKLADLLTVKSTRPFDEDHLMTLVRSIV